MIHPVVENEEGTKLLNPQVIKETNVIIKSNNFLISYFFFSSSRSRLRLPCFITFMCVFFDFRTVDFVAYFFFLMRQMDIPKLIQFLDALLFWLVGGGRWVTEGGRIVFLVQWAKPFFLSLLYLLP